VERLAARLPRGHADLKDQIRRAASARAQHRRGCQSLDPSRQGRSLPDRTG
jgi:hypothetical protein